MTSDNSKSQIDFLDLKIMKIKIQALLLLRFNLRFEIWDFTIRQSSWYLNMTRKDYITWKTKISRMIYYILTLIIFWNKNHLAGCVTLRNNERPTLENVCKELDSEQQIITLFKENYSPINCRSSLEGVFHFSFQVSA